MDRAQRVIKDAADVMTDHQLETAIAVLHTRERELLIVGNSETALDLMGTKFVLLTTLNQRRR